MSQIKTNTGRYDTVEELEKEILRLDRLRKFSQRRIGELTGVSKGTAHHVINANRSESNIPRDRQSLNARLKELWG